MTFVDIRDFEETFEETFVIHFGSEFKRINAYTLASTLVSLADAAKEANSLVNPGYEVEVVVEALGPGSFKAKVRAVYHGLGNLFTKQNLKAIAFGIIASYIYQHTLAPDIEIRVKVDEKTVIIEQADKKIIIPKTVHDALERVERSEKFKEDIGKTFKTLEKDEQIKSVGLARDFEDAAPLMEIPRDKFPLITCKQEDQSPNRQIVEIADLQILRAILERSKRLWQFVWRGIKIPAPVLDHKFYDEFFDHDITIAPGDALKVRLKIYQTRLPDIGIYTNEKYEVIEVIQHIPRPKQTIIDLGKH